MDSKKEDFEIISLSDIGIKNKVPSLPDLFRQYYSENHHSIIFKIDKINNLYEDIELSLFRNNIDLVAIPRNTFIGRLAEFKIKEEDKTIIDLIHDKEVILFDLEKCTVLDLEKQFMNLLKISINKILDELLIVDEKIPEDDTILEEYLLSIYQPFSLSLNETLQKKYHIRSSNINCDWKVLIEDQAHIIHIEALIYYYRKLKFVNSNDAIHQTVDRKLYLRKAYKTYQSIQVGNQNTYF
jgi:hypothetical protein